MNTNLVNRYSNIMNCLNEIILITNDKILKESTEKTLTNLINNLYKVDMTNKEDYLNLLKKYNLNKDNLIDLENSNKNILFDKYEKELENIFKNPNEESIKVWLNNIVSYAQQKNVEEKDLNNFINLKFKELDKDNKFGDRVNALLKEIKSNENKKTEEIIVNEENSNLKNNEELDFSTEESKDETVSKDEKKGIKENENKPLKILKVKKSFISKVKTKALALTALVGIGAIASPSTALGTGIIGYYLYKRGVKSARKIIEKNGLKIDESDKLIDKEGKELTKNDIGKIKYHLVKNELSKLYKANGNIDKNYKKNRLTSLLLKLNNNIEKNVKGKYETMRYNYDAMPQLVQDINLGMRKVK